MQDLEENEMRAVEVLKHFEDSWTHFERGSIALDLIRRWRNAFQNGDVDINETMNFCREAEMFKNEFGLLFHGFYNSNIQLNHKLWEEFLLQSFSKK